MSDFARLSEERPVVLTDVYSPSSIIFPVSTGIRLLGSTTSNLGIGATYTGPTSPAVLSVSYFKYITGLVYADQDGTLYIDHSADGTDFDGVDVVSYFASQPTKFQVETVAPYARVRFVNGAVAQTVFRFNYYGKLI